LSECCQHQRRFRQGEAFADALPRPSTEREIAELMARPTCLMRPTFGIETVWVGVIAVVVVHNPLAGGNKRTARDLVGSEVVLVERASANDPCRWVHT